MKIAVITDAHANLPALQAALRAIHADGCDAIYHIGDAIGIGPHPAECLDLLLSTPNLSPVMGNHEAWFAFGLPQPRPAWMSEAELAHHQWVHRQLNPSLRAEVAQWPWVIEQEIDGTSLAFLHYGLAPGGTDFLSIVPSPTPADLDALFVAHDVDVVFYGHHHPASDLRGRARYVNPGSLGCHTAPVARYVLLDVQWKGYAISFRAISYDDTALFQDLEDRHVPERAFLRQVFFRRELPPIDSDAPAVVGH